MKHSICTFILTFLTLSALTSGTASAANISDKMSLHLVQYLQENKLWLPQYDNEASPEHQDISAFFDELEKTEPNLNEIVDNIFNPIAQTSGFDKFPVNYIQKIKILRYYKNVSAKEKPMGEFSAGPSCVLCRPPRRQRSAAVGCRPCARAPQHRGRVSGQRRDPLTVQR